MSYFCFDSWIIVFSFYPFIIMNAFKSSCTLEILFLPLIYNSNLYKFPSTQGICLLKDRILCHSVLHAYTERLTYRGRHHWYMTKRRRVFTGKTARKYWICVQSKLLQAGTYKILYLLNFKKLNSYFCMSINIWGYHKFMTSFRLD